MDWGTAQWFHQQEYYAQNGWPKLVAFLLAAFLVQVMLPWKREWHLTDPALMTERRGVLRLTDHLFWIPAKYWPMVLCALGIFFYFWHE